MGFVHDEDGAVAVDWVVMTAALVGLGLAVATQVAGGMRETSVAIEAKLGSNHVMDLFDEIRVQDDFEDGRGDWTGGTVREIAGFGNLLALDRNNRSASMPVEVDGGHEYAVIEFDMIVADSWDDETGTISVGGVDLVGVEHAWRNPDGPRIQTFEGSDGTTVKLTRASADSGTWGGSGRTEHDDYTYRVSITKRNDGSDLTLGVGTNLSSSYTDEFFGIDNVEVRGTDRP
jgi:hypothetical protein